MKKRILSSTSGKDPQRNDADTSSTSTTSTSSSNDQEEPNSVEDPVHDVNGGSSQGVGTPQDKTYAPGSYVLVSDDAHSSPACVVSDNPLTVRYFEPVPGTVCSKQVTMFFKFQWSILKTFWEIQLLYVGGQEKFFTISPLALHTRTKLGTIVRHSTLSNIVVLVQHIQIDVQLRHCMSGAVSTVLLVVVLVEVL